MSAKLIDTHLTSIITTDFESNSFLDSNNFALARYAYKLKGERIEKKTYKTVTI